MTFPRSRYLPGFLLLCALFAVSCGAESGSDSLPDNVTEISIERTARTTAQTAETTAAPTSAAPDGTTSIFSETSGEGTSAVSTSASSAVTSVSDSSASSSVTMASSASETETSAVSSVTEDASGFEYTLPEMTWWTPVPTTATTASITSTSTTASAAATSTTVAQPPVSHGNYTLSASDQKFLEGCVFVGDSICSGLKVYKILPANRVVAKGSVGVRNIFTFKFTVGKYETDVISALKSLNPKRVIFSMGMNDINMTTAKQYCTNYQNLLTKAQEALPNAQLYAASITPISANISFSTNSRIDKYNTALQSFLSNYPGWNYLDISKELKTSGNALKKDFNGGDGIHLSPAAYQAVLWQVCKQLNK